MKWKCVRVKPNKRWDNDSTKYLNTFGIKEVARLLFLTPSLPLLGGCAVRPKSAVKFTASSIGTSGAQPAAGKKPARDSPTKRLPPLLHRDGLLHDPEPQWGGLLQRGYGGGGKREMTWLWSSQHCFPTAFVASFCSHCAGFKHNNKTNGITTGGLTRAQEKN